MSNVVKYEDASKKGQLLPQKTLTADYRPLMPAEASAMSGNVNVIPKDHCFEGNGERIKGEKSEVEPRI